MLKALPSFLDAKIRLSIEVNGIFQPFSAALKSMHRFSKPLTFYNRNSGFELSLAGSSFLFTARGRYFAAITNHQLGRGLSKRDISELLVLLNPDKEGKSIARGPKVVSKVRYGEDDEDILIIEFSSDQVEAQSAHFLRWGNAEYISNFEDKEILICVGVGYLSASADYVISEGDDARLVAVAARYSRVVLLPDGKSEIPRCRRFVLHPEFETNVTDFDGFSGAPVFFAVRTNGSNCQLGIGGIVCRAANRIFHVYDAELIAEYVNQL